jgi:hypothetical protein
MTDTNQKLGNTLWSIATLHGVPSGDPGELEAELNDRVAHLYGLTAEEKKIVAGLMPAKSETYENEEEGE